MLTFKIKMEDSLVKIVVILFILSLMTERVAEFIKLRCPFWFDKTNLNERELKKREGKIQLLTISVGILVAFSTRADFFLMIQSGTIIPWTQNSAIDVQVILGCVITGIFLSQGSKFFHDLLDTVLYYKNLKKSLYSHQEILNSEMISKSKTADELLNQVLYQDRNDEPDNHL